VYVYIFIIVFLELNVILIKEFTFFTPLPKARKRHSKLRNCRNFD